MKNEEMEEKRPTDPVDEKEKEDFRDPSETGYEDADDDISLYYPDGDAEHMAADDGEEDGEEKDRSRKKNKARKKNTRLTKSQIALIAVVFILYTAVIVTASWILFYKPPQAKVDDPLPFDAEPIRTDDPNAGPPLHYNEGTGENVTDDPTKDVPPFENPPEDPGKEAETEAPKITPAVTSKWNAKENDYNILVVGMDKQAKLADITMIVNVNAGEGKMSVMQIPRDTLITTGVNTDKINAQYASLVNIYSHQGYSDPYMTALSDYARILERSLCIKIHYTVLVDLDGFPKIVDSVGPIAVFVPDRMKYEDPEQDLYIDIPAGWNELDGKNAEGFVRFRSGYVQADLGRVNAQKIFLTALYQKVVTLLKNMDVSKITDLAQVVLANVTTDMTVSDLIYFSRAFMNIGMSNVTMLTVPGDMANESWNAHYVVNRAATLQIINDYFNIYDRMIEDSFFDKNWTFCYNYPIYTDIYYAPANYAYTSEYTADEIAEDSIAIPFMP